jgi:sugar O-acyltransferase (sialic acid O-acetyltransferase NeuD family)
MNGMKVIFVGAANPETKRMILSVQRVQPNFDVAGFIDNDPSKKGTMFHGHPVFGGFEMLDELLRDDDVRFVNLITGSTKTRFETSRTMAARGCRFTNFLHPSIDLTMTRLGVGNYLQENVVIQAEVEIGNNASIHIGTLVGHETKIGHSVFIAHGCSISGSVTIGDGVFMGTHATVLPRLRIGKWATVGAGAVVTKDVPDYATVVGSPAKVIKVAEPLHEHGDIFAAWNG